MGRARLLVSDFVLSFMWVWSGVLLRILVFKHLGFAHGPLGEVIKTTFSVANMFFFAFLVKVTRGAAYNPLTVLADAITGDFNTFLYCVGARIPAQVVGSIVGVKLLIDTIPEVGVGPRLNVDIHQGSLTEGLLTFAIVTISLGLATKIRENFFMKTWISSLSKLTLHILGSDLTGGCMNPASKPCLTCSGNGMGLCSRGSHNKGALSCVLACSHRSNYFCSVDIQISSAAWKRT
ncbi:putative aquaporin SIP2-1 isoform B [Glycine soja]|uniref:Putative aquaporin SIP2-1 isoform B n=1 Tax=Glycine soja TaxID=3848 RepID=A0A445LAF1_GLYSO|nr:putative aquaporin SIP2-1 isoform B [Glycine soja]